MSVLTLDDALAAPAHHRVLTGDRPTGALHLGHYLGTLRSRVLLQDAGVRTFLVIADHQVVTDRDTTAGIADNVHEVLLDYLAVGLDGPRTTIFTHSAVAAIGQLMLPFLSLVTDAELRRNPTVKAELAATGARPMSALLLTYPVHQAADILFAHATLVPVGRDQLPHLELTRTVARRFTRRYGALFEEPAALLSDAPTVLGTDGTKMSKTRGNVVALRDDEDTTAAVLRSAVTDGERHITYEPERRPEVANLLLIAALLLGRAPEAVAEEIGAGGAGRLKAVVTEAVNEHLRPVRARRRALAADRAHVAGLLADGNAVAAGVADATLGQVRAAMGMAYGV